MRIERRFTVEGQSPYSTIDFRNTVSEIRNPDGSLVFRLDDIKVPAAWSQVAADVLAQKYFRKAGIPAALKPVAEKDVPEWLWRNEADRKANETALDQIIGAWCATRERWAIARTLAAAGVPAFPSMSMRDLLEDPHLNARGCFTHWQHPEVGQRTLMGAPWRFSNRPNGMGSHAPLLGQHTDAVLQEILGLDAEQRQRLRAEGVVE